MKLYTRAWLHADDAEMIALVDPQQELLALIVVDEDAASLGPVLMVTRRSLHPVLTPENTQISQMSTNVSFKGNINMRNIS